MSKSFKEVKNKFLRIDNEVNNSIHWFSHKISPYISFVFIRLGFSANTITALFLIIGVTGATLVNYSILSYLLWRLHIILDMSDGDVARYNKSFSAYGKYWDRMNHSIINPLYCFFIGYKFFVIFHDLEFIFLGVALMFVQFIYLNSKYYLDIDNLSIRHNTSKNKLLNKTKNIVLDFLGMEGVLFFMVLLGNFHSPLTIRTFFYIYIVLFITVATIKFYERSFKFKANNSI